MATKAMAATSSVPRRWFTDEVAMMHLAGHLNAIEGRGGVVFTIVDGTGTRREFVLVVWYQG